MSRIVDNLTGDPVRFQTRRRYCPAGRVWRSHLNTEPFWVVASLVLGPAVGSFIGLLSLRLPADRPVVVSRSACAGCDRPLAVVDLVPILSFALLRARCRTCGAAIPWRYVLLETACLAVGVWAAWAIGGPQSFIGALLGWWLLLLAVIDAEHFWLPDRLTLPLAAFGLAAAYAVDASTWLDHLIGAAAGFLFCVLLAEAYRRLRGREGLGGGDARLLAAAGAWVGWAGLPSVLLWASLSGLAAVAGARLFGRRIAADDQVPFGVFLAIGIWLTWLYGPLGLGGR